MNLLFIDHHSNFNEMLVPGFFKELGKHSKVLIVHQNHFLKKTQKSKPTEIFPNVWSVQRSPLAPYRIVLISDYISKLDSILMKFQINKYLSYLGFQVDITEFISPFFRNHIQRFRSDIFSKKISFWFLDHYSKVPDQPPFYSAILKNFEINCAKSADVVFTTSRKLKSIFQDYSKQIVFIPNSADEDTFLPKWKKNFDEPDILKKYTRPIIGYAGGINSILDWEALLFVSKARPNYTFLLFGWIDGNEEFRNNAIFRETMRQKNVHYMGKVPYSDLPAIYAHLDAGLILDAPNEFSKTRNQNKVYQFLLSGIPVVGPFAQPDYLPFASLLHLSYSKEEFPDKIDLALQTNTLEASKKRRAYAEKISLKTVVKYRMECYERILNNQPVFDFVFPSLE